MPDPFRTALLLFYRAIYRTCRPIIFRRSAQQAHEEVLRWLSRLDRSRTAQLVAKSIHTAAFQRRPVTVGSVDLPYPFILAAGLVKGTGFEAEDQALATVRQGINIIPGWRTVPSLVGLVEFGSFTRWPRLGNPGTVIWRDPATRSTQNRVGLRNPGAAAAAEFLSLHKDDLPGTFGINIAPSPGVPDIDRQKREVLDSIDAFIARGIRPAWFTLNLSCPNTEDDPANRQTESQARAICGAVLDCLRGTRARHSTPSDQEPEIPLWVKISPGMAASQYDVLIRVFHEVGVRAVIASNTLAQPSPDGDGLPAGVAGGRLHPHAVDTVRILSEEKARHGYNVDIIACGGIFDRATFRAYADYGVNAAQYYSAMVYRGPLAAALMI